MLSEILCLDERHNNIRKLVILSIEGIQKTHMEVNMAPINLPNLATN